ncbi:MAG: exodeoxyribonuclease VII small subunit [Anaerolineae bacterium]|nr:exodeoxyribonuclease VII small subunit [Anaerolineae bacterium]
MTSLQPEQPFEDAFQELADIVDQLEAGDLTLDDTLKLYERGRALVQYCQVQLNDAELRVMQLTTGADGTLKAEDLT